MVSIGLSGDAVSRLRFALSCLWEVVASVRVLREPGAHAVHLPWVTAVRNRLDPDLADGLLWRLVPAGRRYLPDFLTPPPQGLTTDLDAELAALCATPPATVRAELDLYGGAGLTELYDDPVGGLHRLATEIRRYWAVALAPDWPRILVLLEAEVFRQARRQATTGAADLLNDLHEWVHWSDDTLSIAQRHCAAPDVPGGTGLVLVPSVFVWPTVLSVAAGSVPQLAYPARGVATLWEPTGDVSGALGRLLGQGRAALLGALSAPLSTSELARRTGMSVGGVSQQLDTLSATGLVRRTRQGKAVLNSRTALADALLSAAR